MKKTPIVLSLALLALLIRCGTTTTTTTATATATPKPQIARIWHGQVPASRGEEYAKYLYENGVLKLRSIPRNLGVQMFRRTIGDREDFLVISYWPSEDAIHAYAGDDITKARFLPRDREFLIDPETEVRHYRIAAQ